MPNSMLVLIGLLSIGCIFLGWALFMVYRRMLNLRQNFTLAEQAKVFVELSQTKLTNELNQQVQKVMDLQIQKAELQTQLDMLQNTLNSERSTFDRLKEQMTHAFESLASKVLRVNGEQFLQTAKELLNQETQGVKVDLQQRSQMFEATLRPLQESLNRLQNQNLALEQQRQNSIGSIATELKKVVESSENLRQQTQALKDALKRPHVRGRWGELQLRNCIELAGMSEYADLTFQEITTLENGQKLVPDLVVKMPGGRVVIVDAKTPIDAFLTALESTSEEERQTQLVRHGRHIKEHILRLSTKAYNEQCGASADFTIMFLPNESFLYAALESEPNLVEFALQKKILIATPPTFIGLLKVIRFGWSEEKLARNAEEISTAARELHKRLVDFTDSLLGMGKYLQKAQNEYDVTVKRFNSRVLTQARRIEELGAKSTKPLPEMLPESYSPTEPSL